MEFSRILKEIREAKGLSQTELANLVCISESAICQYERGGRYPSAEILVKISKSLNVSCDYLLGLKSEDKNNDETKLKNLLLEKERLIFKMNINLILFGYIDNNIKLEFENLNKQINKILSAEMLQLIKSACIVESSFLDKYMEGLNAK